MSHSVFASVARPLISIFLMQSVLTMAIYSLPVIIPVAAPSLGISPESVGFFISINYGVSMLGGLFTGALIARFGATGVFRLMLAITSLAVLVLMFSTPHAVVLMALLIGISSGPMNPTGSHVMARVTPLHQRATVFSLKQCATPAGGVLAGLILPPLMLAYGWQWAMLTIPFIAVVLIILAPLGNIGSDADRAVSGGFSLRKTLDSMAVVASIPAIRSLTTAAVCLAAAQMALTTYLVVYLWSRVGLSEAAAGAVFALLHISGISARVVLGFAADRLGSARWILVALCAILAGALILLSNFDSDWPITTLYLVVSVAGATGNGWVGLYYAELARLTPADQIASVTGASQFFTYSGLLLGPLLFGALLALSDSYALAFLAFAALMILATVYLIRANRQQSTTQAMA